MSFMTNHVVCIMENDKDLRISILYMYTFNLRVMVMRQMLMCFAWYDGFMLFSYCSLFCSH